jgi:hypothetical protein
LLYKSNVMNAKNTYKNSIALAIFALSSLNSMAIIQKNSLPQEIETSHFETICLPSSITCPVYQIQSISLTESAQNNSVSGQTSFSNQNPNDSIFVICKPNTSKNIKMYEESAFSSFEIYPNPTSQKIVIKIDARFSGAVCSIYNLVGELVFKLKFDKDLEQIIDISQLPKGVYFVKLEFSNESMIKKFVKR